MGKNIRTTAISLQNNHPGCMWGILNILTYHHWRYIKKRLPHKRQGGRKNAGSRDPGKSTKPSIPDDLQTHSNSEIVKSIEEEESRELTPTTKNSVTAQIKVLITEEKIKKKGRHHRSSTYPVQKLKRSDSIHHLESFKNDPLLEIELNNGSTMNIDQNNYASSAPSSEDPLLLKASEESSSRNEANGECGTLLPANDLGSNKVHENGKKLCQNCWCLEEELQLVKHTLLNQKLINTKELFIDESLSQSKIFLDGLDLVNTNQESLLRILPDPSLPWRTRHFHSQERFGAKMGFTKSISFPALDSRGRKSSRSSTLKQREEGSESHRKEERNLHLGDEGRKSGEVHSTEDRTKQSMELIDADHRTDGILKQNQTIPEIANSYSGSEHHLKRQGDSQGVVKRFQDLKQKIRYVIKESKSERYRITMDAILHKIPHEHGFPKDLKKEIGDQFKDLPVNRSRKDSSGMSYEGDHCATFNRKIRQCHMRRTSSLNGSIDRYLQLYESSFKKETKHHVSDRLELGIEEASLPCKSTSKSLGRIFSLPDLKSCYYTTDGSPEAFSSRMQVDSSVSICSLDDHKRDVPTTSEDQLQSGSFAEVEILEQLDIIETNSVISTQLGSTSGMNNEANTEVGEKADDLINLVIGDNLSYNDQEIEPARKLISEPAEASPLLPGFCCEEDFADFFVSEDSELNPPHLASEVDCFPGQQQESIMDTPMLAERVESKKIVLMEELESKSMHVNVDAKDKAKFDYVKDILELSGFSGSELLGTWHSDEQPVDPSLSEEVPGCVLLDPDCPGNEEGGNCNHLLFFYLINEVLMEIYERSYSYWPMPLSSLCHVHPMPVGNHVLKEVWTNISWYLRPRPEDNQSLDYAASRDLARDDEWMNLQFDTECIGLEVEDLILNDLLLEVIST